MKKQILFCVFFIFNLIHSQQPKTPSSTYIYESLQKLNFLGSVLYIAAHPDDENTRLIAYMANHIKARTAYLSLTRGDGGQNLIGPEIRSLLGVIRTQELLAARRVDGGEQLFTRANDFGYSKHPEETLNIWNKDLVLSDVILAIRKFKPDIIINRFDHRTPGTTHGHHTSSALLSLEAFNKSNKKHIYPKQLKNNNLWQPKRLFFNTSWWFYGSKEKFNTIDKNNLVNFDIGVYYPLKGLSNNEIAAQASSKHLCQGFGRLTQRGTQKEYLEFLEGMPLKDKKNIFDGINTTWSRIKGGKAIGDILYNIERNFNFKNPSSHLNALLKAYVLIEKLEDSHWKHQKTKAIKSIIEACTGLYLEASASTNWATQNDIIDLNIEAINRSNNSVLLKNISITNGKKIDKNILLKTNIKQAFKTPIKIDKNIKPTTPYWLNSKNTLGMYKAKPEFIGLPETPRVLFVNFNLIINKTPITYTKAIIQRYAKPDKGQLYRPFEIVPELSVKINEKVIIFDTPKQKTIKVEIKALKNHIKGYVEIDASQNWKISPRKQQVNIEKQGETQTVTFNVIPPKQQNEGYITPIVTVGNKTYKKTLIKIDYNHIPTQTVLLPSKTKVVLLDIKKHGNKIAYIKGAGDVVPESLEQIGYTVTPINVDNITQKHLSNFDAVVVGIRAYNILDNLKFKQQILFNFIANGGNMVVQYNTNHRLKIKDIAPYKLTLSRDRVTNENAAVTFINPNHDVLNKPNKITQQDFKGWTQERGLYFPNYWDKAFTPILSMHDKNETPKQGSLLIAKYGKGHYIYTGLSFFREFPAGVPGAYRLFANMLSLGKTNQ